MFNMLKKIKKLISPKKDIKEGELCRLRQDKYSITVGWHEHRHRWVGNPETFGLPQIKVSRPKPDHGNQIGIILGSEPDWIYYRYNKKTSKYYVRKHQSGYPKSISKKKQLGKAVLVQWADGAQRYEFESDLEAV